MVIMDLQGQTIERTEPLVIDPRGDTVISNGKIKFSGCDGIKFRPTKPSDAVRVSTLSLRDVKIVAPDGTGLELIGCGKETTISGVNVTAETGAIFQDWDGGSITDFYAFDCSGDGVRIDRMHAAMVDIDSRQSGGTGIDADGMRVVKGQLYAESNDGDGLVFRNCRHNELSLHVENNNRAISGVVDWDSNGHKFLQTEFYQCEEMDLTGVWGQYTGQWVSDAPTASLLKFERLPAQLDDEWSLEPPGWDRYWRDERYVPHVEMFGHACRITYPAGCFDHTNQRRDRYWLQRWSMVDIDPLPGGSLVQVQAHVGIPSTVRAALMAMHYRGEENGIGTVGFLGFGYRPTTKEKNWQALHAWNGREYPAVYTRTWIREDMESPVSVVYQPCMGIGSWDNPAFEAVYRWDVVVRKSQ